MKLTLLGTFLTPMETPLCVKLRTQHGGKEPDSLCAGLMLSFRKHKTHISELSLGPKGD